MLLMLNKKRSLYKDKWISEISFPMASGFNHEKNLKAFESTIKIFKKMSLLQEVFHKWKANFLVLTWKVDFSYKK